jgi:WD40 repeat protein
MNRSAALIALLTGIMSVTNPRPGEAQDSPSEVTWDQVKPVFQKRCFACHRGEQARGGLDLTTVAGIKAGSVSGAAVVTGKPEDSMIYTLPAHLENPKMPPSGARLSQWELDLIFGWIRDGMSERVTAATSTLATTRTTRPSIRPSMRSVAVPKPASPIVMKSSTVNAVAKPVAAPIQRTITAIAASPTSSLIAVAVQSDIHVYQWADRTLVRTIEFPEGDVFCMKFSADGGVLLAGGGIGGASGKAIGYDSTTGEILFDVGAESDLVLAADLAPDGRLVALGGPSRIVRLMDSTSGHQIAEIKKHTDWILSTAFSPDGLLLATGDRFGSLQIWEAATGKEFWTLRGHTGPIHRLSWSADSATVLSAGEDGTLRQWDMHQGQQLQSVPGEVGGILAAETTAAGMLIFGGRNKTLAIRSDLQANSHSVSLADEVTHLAITQDGSHAIAADVTGRVKLFQLPDATEAGELFLPN